MYMFFIEPRNNSVTGFPVFSEIETNARFIPGRTRTVIGWLLFSSIGFILRFPKIERLYHLYYSKFKTGLQTF